MRCLLAVVKLYDHKADVRRLIKPRPKSWPTLSIVWCQLKRCCCEERILQLRIVCRQEACVIFHHIQGAAK